MGVKFAEFGDLHLNENDALGVYDPVLGMNTRLYYKIETLKSISDYLLIKHSNLDFVVFKGDVYNSINPSDLLRSLFNSVVKLFLENGIRVVIIPGNHETTGQLTAFESDKLLAEGLVNEPNNEPNNDHYIAQSEASMMTIADKKFVLIPWGKDAYLEKVEAKDEKVLFGHFTVEGVDFGSYKTKKRGFEISKKELNKYKYVSLGHIHKPQEYYSGSMFKNTFGERDNKCVYRICEWDKEITVEEKESDLIKLVQIELEEGEWVEDRDYVNSIVKIIFRGERSDLKQLNLFQLRKAFVSQYKPIKLILKKEVNEIPNAVEVKSEGNKVLNFSEVLSQLTDNKKLITYVSETIGSIE
jgi:DNA repair exonuclease SbcCD nuclease subunit